MQDKELTTYQKLLLTVDLNSGRYLPSVLIEAKILAECIDGDKYMTSDEYTERAYELETQLTDERISSTTETGRFKYDGALNSLVLEFDEPRQQKSGIRVTPDVDIPCQGEGHRPLEDIKLIINEAGQVGAMFEREG